MDRYSGRIAQILDRWRCITPDAPALQEGGQSLSYAELGAAAESLSRELAAQGAGPGERVCIVAENGCAQVAALFAASRLGAWPVLVNARNSAREVAAIIAHAAPRVTLFATERSAEARAHAQRCGAAGTLQAGAAGMRLSFVVDAAAVAERGAEAAAVAALIYTSGTTGAPKGVMTTHRGLSSFAARSATVRRLAPGDVVLGALPMSHIFGIATILLTTLHAGGCVLLQPRFDAAATLDALRGGALSLVHGVPTLYTRLLEQCEREGVRGPFPGLRYAYAGGGALDPALKRAVETLLCLPLHHGYGMTEYAGSMFVTHVDRPRADTLPGELAPDCEVRFVGEDGREAAPGTPGEVQVRGPGTMFGYYRDQELTRRTVDADGWLHTGDHGYLETDGALRLVGRSRDIIKRSGFTVYPQEVEQQLLEHPDVRLAGVVGVPAAAGEEAIVAFVEMREPGKPLDATALLAYLRERLSHYKCPQHVVQLAHMPLTVNGKIRKQDLRDAWLAR